MEVECIVLARSLVCAADLGKLLPRSAGLEWADLQKHVGAGCTVSNLG